MSLGVYQDQKWKKPQRPKPPLYRNGKFKATHSPPVETDNRRAPQENEYRHRTIGQ